MQKKKKSKSGSAPAAKRWGVGAVVISPSSFIKAAPLSSPSQPSSPVYPQPTHFKGAAHSTVTLSELSNRQMSSLISSSTRSEQTSGSNGLFRLLSLSVRDAKSSFFIILTLFFSLSSGLTGTFQDLKINKSNANILTLEAEWISPTLSDTVIKNCLLLFTRNVLS